MSDDLPDEIMVWRSNPKLPHVGTWATTRYPAEAVAYVPAATITALSADLDAANDRAEKAEAFIRNDADWKFSAKRRLALFREQRKRAEAAEANAAALRTQVDEAWNAAIEEAAEVAYSRNWSITGDLILAKKRAVLAPAAPEKPDA